MNDWLEELKHEYENPEWITNLHSFSQWNRSAFSRLSEALRKCCEAVENDSTVQKWAAEMFYFYPLHARECVGRMGTASEEEKEYYERTLERLNMLAYWFFFGQSPYIGDSGFEPL